MQISSYIMEIENCLRSNSRITCADKGCCPDPCVVATHARRSPRCTSPAADNALPSRRRGRDSSTPSSASPPRNPDRCNIEGAELFVRMIHDRRAVSVFEGQLRRYVVLMIAKWCVISAYGLTRNSCHFREDVSQWFPIWESLSYVTSENVFSRDFLHRFQRRRKPLKYLSSIL